MKYLCASCERLAEASRFAIDNGQLVLFCARCGAETRALGSEGIGLHASEFAVGGPARVLPLHAVPPPTFSGEDPFAIPAGHCQKCVSPRPDAAAPCRYCGLVSESAEVAGLEPSSELRALWTELIPTWDDLKAHDTAVAAVAARGELAAMGRLYRIRLARQPMDPIALRGRDEVVRAASSATPLSLPRPATPQRMSQALLWGILLCAAVVMVMLIQMFFRSPAIE